MIIIHKPQIIYRSPPRHHIRHKILCDGLTQKLTKNNPVDNSTIVYTNGSAIFQISLHGEQPRLFVGKFIDFLAVI